MDTWSEDNVRRACAELKPGDVVWYERPEITGLLLVLAPPCDDDKVHLVYPLVVTDRGNYRERFRSGRDSPRFSYPWTKVGRIENWRDYLPD